ncbi:MAG: hypothetical protein OXN79_04700 [bacterium]|nr:hypothetical protein [bacterium]
MNPRCALGSAVEPFHDDDLLVAEPADISAGCCYPAPAAVLMVKCSTTASWGQRSREALMMCVVGVAPQGTDQPSGVEQGGFDMLFMEEG